MFKVILSASIDLLIRETSHNQLSYLRRLENLLYTQVQGSERFLMMSVLLRNRCTTNSWPQTLRKWNLFLPLSPWMGVKTRAKFTVKCHMQLNKRNYIESYALLIEGSSTTDSCSCDSTLKWSENNIATRSRRRKDCVQDTKWIRREKTNSSFNSFNSKIGSTERGSTSGFHLIHIQLTCHSQVERFERFIFSVFSSRLL